MAICLLPCIFVAVSVLVSVSLLPGLLSLSQIRVLLRYDTHTTIFAYLKYKSNFFGWGGRVLLKYSTIYTVTVGHFITLRNADFLSLQIFLKHQPFTSINLLSVSMDVPVLDTSCDRITQCFGLWLLPLASECQSLTDL